jgi:hypothetical protein
MADVTGFKFIEFHARRAQRGAEAARVEVTYDDGTTDLLWMSRRDLARNLMAFGCDPELVKAREAYCATGVTHG